MAEDYERAFAAVARVEDNLRSELASLNSGLREELRNLEARMADRMERSIESMKNLIDSQTTARDSALKEAISELSRARATELAKCADHRRACAERIVAIEQWKSHASDRHATEAAWHTMIDGWRDSTDRWRRNYWPRFIVYSVLVAGAIATFAFTVLNGMLSFLSSGG